PVGVLPARHAAVHNADRSSAVRDQWTAALLPRGAGRARWARLRDAEAQNAATERRGTARPLPRRRARTAHARRDDRDRRLAARDPAGRDPTALERRTRRHEPRRPATDPAPVLRGARRGAPGLLAAARRPPGAHRLRAGATRLRDIDGGEACARPRVDRRSFVALV